MYLHMNMPRTGAVDIFILCCHFCHTANFLPYVFSLQICVTVYQVSGVLENNYHAQLPYRYAYLID